MTWRRFNLGGEIAGFPAPTQGIGGNCGAKTNKFMMGDKRSASPARAQVGRQSLRNYYPLWCGKSP